ncbi:YwdI family protein [Ureibacillus acetophenoni]|uniref:Uncharacterized protein n=1 Tax=Ureibacillus acetophenoni TaxID=614649 RepID=A0A285TYA4_9BACL|nr:YwdI family protein [Ureibacillus acetophenoni]SOC34670.1 hypothetical protein SAMN05877842_1016 [Ureibacillus acetophenoni]
MISTQTLLQQIEKHTQLAKSTENDQLIREQLIAIRALCELALTEQSSNISVTKNHFQQQSLPQTVQLNRTTEPSLQSNPIKEDDGANGNSIFDF